MQEDMILPEGFTEDTVLPETDGVSQDNDVTETVEDTPPTTEPTTTEPVTEQPKVKLKYNHEDRELSLDEVVPLAQKGLNYDKLQEKLNAIQNDPRLSKYEQVEKVSQLLGYQSDDELLSALFNTYYESTAQQQGLTPDQVRKEHELKQKEESLNNQNKQIQLQEQKTKMYEQFLSNFNDVKLEDIKPETWAKVNAGMDLTTAYIQQRNQELELENKILRQNEMNSKKAPVSGTTVHGSSQVEGKDPFLDGFNSI